jgi:hypothetical protein
MLRYLVGIFASLSLAALLFTGCGSGGSCEDAGAALCKRAAACSGDGSARLLSPIGDAGTGVATITFKSESDCDALYQFGCSQEPSPMVDFAACESAAEKAHCGTSPDGKGVISPAACNSK